MTANGCFGAGGRWASTSTFEPTDSLSKDSKNPSKPTPASGREQADTRPTVQSLFERVAHYARDDDERALLDLGFRTAFSLHSDYWSDYEVRLVPATPGADCD